MYMYMYVAIVINNTKLIASTASTVWMNEKSIRAINSLVYTIKWLYVYMCTCIQVLVLVL